MGERRRWARQWRIVGELYRARRGRTAKQLQEALSVGRSTVYRDLKSMLDSGLPFRKERVGGEVRYAFDGELPDLRPDGEERRILRWAKVALRPFRGTRAFDLLEALVASDEDDAELSAPEPPMSEPSVLRAIEGALGKHRLRLRYRDRTGHTSWRDVEPLALHFAAGDLYLLAHCLAVDEPRTFKVLRIQHATPLGQPITARRVDLPATFGRSVKAFTGDPIDVVVRLGPTVAAIAAEYPLTPDQRLEVELDGSVVITARVSGYLETLRWVLGWGAAAEALEPPVLREAVRSELMGALRGYGPGVKRVVPGGWDTGRVPKEQK